MSLKILAVDFDHTLYSGGWTGLIDLPHGPCTVETIPWLEENLRLGHRVIIHTCRLTNQPEGSQFFAETLPNDQVVDALHQWFLRNGLSLRATMKLEYWTGVGKPFAHVYLDDRGWRFTGQYPTLEEIDQLEK